ncbi:hypothetical protein CB0940_03551 [Cercospora beticola]|uniref:Uncharacterized protein n=1 Tax=Cercospora beticola TaxID=122368 RepID=A0A2G5I3D7_CERBT|nr:hypothetical protein CB0940_03551 [Cercospora beticola]PIA99290.1 hypothetical protein CB0940_03551 [Cercospora beticola]WPB00727.1 hypothetical protein RHO25_005347 [Cercospora beticola]CAK1361039.1 unnamed protein product [Cercospora beticola]
MTLQQEFNSWWAPKSNEEAPTSSVPQIGSQAPQPVILALQSNQRTVLAFLRHCGCPFAEKTYLLLREAAKTHRDIDFLAISHSDQTSTDKWLKSIPQFGSEPANLRIIVDADREAYNAYGLSVSSWGHVLSAGSMWNVWNLAKNEGISNRPTESGSRWQTSGTFAIGEDGRVKWGGAANRADDIPNFEEAVKALDSGKVETKL